MIIEFKVAPNRRCHFFIPSCIHKPTNYYKNSTQITSLMIVSGKSLIFYLLTMVNHFIVFKYLIEKKCFNIMESEFLKNSHGKLNNSLESVCRRLKFHFLYYSHHQKRTQ
jgi:hypothetical protein